MHKVYVAAKFEDKTRVRELYKRIRAWGDTRITFDWTVHDDTEYVGKEKEDYRKACALDDFDAVMGADATLLLAHPNGKGQYTELGIALSQGQMVFLVGAEEIMNIFFWHPNVIWCESVDEALVLLKNYLDTQGLSWSWTLTEDDSVNLTPPDEFLGLDGQIRASSHRQQDT